MEIKPIHSDEDYEEALKRLSSLMHAKRGTEEGDELEIISAVIGIYEKKHFPLEDDLTDPIDMLEFSMDQMMLTNADVAKILKCSRGRVSEILNRRRPLSLKMMRTLSKEMHIPIEMLVQEYEIIKPVKKKTAVRPKVHSRASPRLSRDAGQPNLPMPR